MNQVINYNRVEKAIRYLKENYQSQPSLDQVARHIRLSKFHFQRLFEDWAGVSPKLFVQYLTVEHAKKLLEKGQSTLNTSYDLGLSGSGRLHDLFVKIESVTPGQYKLKGQDERIEYGFYDSLFGSVCIAETQKGICLVEFFENKAMMLNELKIKWKNADLVEKEGKYAKAAHGFLNKKSVPKGKISLDLKGSDFQIKVWEALLKIPQGQLVSYGDIAKVIGSPKACRAVGSAIGKNPIAYIIPCHRVIRETGDIGQYRWGRVRKSSVIGWESANFNLA